ncbi:uncharacterized protein ACO6RY_03920 [Pungitius sinensis]
MSACCVSGCKSTSTGGRQFFKVPFGSMPFTANRRRLWLKALKPVNGSTKELGRNAFVCSAHFKSQRAALNPDSPDFVPSVFTCAKRNRKKKRQSIYRPIRRQRHKADVEVEEKTTPPRVDSPMVLRSSVMVTQIQTSSTPSSPQEGETLTKEHETETTPVKSSQTTSSPHKASASFNTAGGIPQLDKRSPFVLLKNIYRSPGGYLCEHCDQSFANVSQLMGHRKLQSTFVCEKCGLFFQRQADFTEHRCVPEPSFPCNMCDRSFSAIPNLKRHRLMHVKDGRKCPTCGALFCQRHSHVLFPPLPPSVTEYEEDSAATGPQNVYGTLKDKTPKISSEIFVPPLCQPPFQSGPPPPVTKVTRRPTAASRPASFARPLLPQHPELPPSLKLFSPKYLTSAFLQVKRNYEYILSKPKGVKETVVKEEPCLLIPPREQSVANIKKERTAYNLEVVL